MIIKSERSKKSPPHISTSIGDLVVFYLTLSDQVKIENYFRAEQKKDKSDEAIRKLIKYVCFPLEDLGEKNHKPDSISLSDNDIAKLTTDDLEKISECYIKENEDLYSEKLSETSKDEDGKTVITFTNGDITHPKKESDSWTEYLYELLNLEFKDLRESFNSSMLSKNFSDILGSNIAQTLSMGSSLSKKITEIQHPFKSSFDAIEKMSDSINKINIPRMDISSPIQREWDISKDVLKLDRLKEENRARPFNELGEKLNKLIEINSDSGKFIVDMNKTQLEVANEIKASSDTSSKHSQRNILLTYFVVALTIVGLGLSIFNSIRDSNIAKNEQIGLQDALTVFNENIQTLTQSIDSSFYDSNASQEEVKLLIENQEAEITRLTNQLDLQKETILNMEIEILKLQEVPSKEQGTTKE